MSWRLQVNHTTGYHYSGEVVSSYNEARITPLTDIEQLTIDATVDITPAARAYRYWDYWGCLVHAFDVHVPHRQLIVTGRSLVETSEDPDPLADPGATWTSIDEDATCDRYDELLAPTAYVPFVSDRVRDQARELRAAGSPHAAALAAATWVRDSLVYERGVTRVSTSAVEAWDAGHGVCQDFAHLTLTMVRAMGVPCRYVSGYLHPEASADVGRTVRGESHAWVEWWAGEWVRFDPTNGIPVGQRHVVVGRGRDYADVSPLKGIYSGGAAGDLEVTVELTRVA
ncbi:MAG TPA: transglutaminase family protein [Acidimicrobiales bacterium]|nr:transglutaminase family protein [Acidimicrobiales bacterium]